jgi:hypothetical protein
MISKRCTLGENWKTWGSRYSSLPCEVGKTDRRHYLNKTILQQDFVKTKTTDRNCARILQEKKNTGRVVARRFFFLTGRLTGHCDVISAIAPAGQKKKRPVSPKKGSGWPLHVPAGR